MRLKRKTAIGIIIGICGVALTAWIILMLTVFGGTGKDKDKAVTEPVPEGMVRVWRPTVIICFADGKESYRKICKYDEAGNRTTEKYKGGDRETQSDFTYDEYGRMLTEEVSTGSKYEYSYDEQGGKRAILWIYREDTEKREIGLDYLFDPEGRKIVHDIGSVGLYFTYDINGRRISDTAVYEDGKREELFDGECDEQGRLIRNFHDSGTVSRECRYDENGTHVTCYNRTEGQEFKREFAYDADGRLVSVGAYSRYAIWSEGDGWEESERCELEYDAAGRLIRIREYSAEMGVTVKEWTYNEKDRLVKYVHSKIGDVSGTAFPMEEVIREYDKQGRLVAEMHEKNWNNNVMTGYYYEEFSSTKTYTYDANGCIASIRETEERKMSGGQTERSVCETDIEYAYFDVTPELAKWMQKYDSPVNGVTEVDYGSNPYNVEKSLLIGDLADDDISEDDHWEYLTWGE